MPAACCGTAHHHPTHPTHASWAHCFCCNNGMVAARTADRPALVHLSPASTGDGPTNVTCLRTLACNTCCHLVCIYRPLLRQALGCESACAHAQCCTACISCRRHYCPIDCIGPRILVAAAAAGGVDRGMGLLFVAMLGNSGWAEFCDAWHCLCVCKRRLQLQQQHFNLIQVAWKRLQLLLLWECNNGWTTEQKQS